MTQLKVKSVPPNVELAQSVPAPVDDLPAGVVLYSALRPETALTGPAVIYEESSSTFVPAGWLAQLDNHGAIWLRG